MKLIKYFLFFLLVSGFFHDAEPEEKQPKGSLVKIKSRTKNKDASQPTPAPTNVPEQFEEREKQLNLNLKNNSEKTQINKNGPGEPATNKSFDDIKSSGPTHEPVKTESTLLNVINTKAIENLGKEIHATTKKITDKKYFLSHRGIPYAFQGIPILYYLYDQQWGYGFKVSLYNVAHTKPFVYGLNMYFLQASRNTKRINMSFDYPDLFEYLRIKYNFWMEQDANNYFFGPGNKSEFDRDKEDYYKYSLKKMGGGLTSIFNFDEKRHNFFLGLLFKSYNIYDLGKTANNKSLLLDTRPAGFSDEYTNLFKTGYYLDLRDSEFMPTRGLKSEVAVSFYTKYLGSDKNFYKPSFTTAYFYPLQKQFIFAYNFIVDTSFEDAHFMELSTFTTTEEKLGLGGPLSLRGYVNQRFYDRSKFSNLFELRCYFYSFDFFYQHFDMLLIPFFDFGRVWSGYPFTSLRDLHYSGGIGSRFVWNSRFIIRSDFALSPEMYKFHVGFGDTF